MKTKRKKFFYDSESDTLYISIRKGKEDYFEEIEPNIIVEFNKMKQPLGIEILNASWIFKKIIKYSSFSVVNDKSKVYQAS